MKCLIVDDEALARERLSRLLGETGDWQVCGEAGDGAAAVRLAVTEQPDIILLDIRMPGMDGLEVARHLAGSDKPPAIIFTTAFGDHALEAFEAQAVDYLLKPIHPERLLQALEKARRVSATQLEGLHFQQAGRARTHICVRSRGNLELLAVDEVVYFQADSKYVMVCSPGKQVLIEESLKSLEQEFSAGFLRIHRNALVAVRAIRGMEKDGKGQHWVIMDGVGERLEVSRRLVPEVRRRIKLGA